MASRSTLHPLNHVPVDIGGVLRGDQYQDPRLTAYKDDPVVSALSDAFKGYRTLLANVKKSVEIRDDTQTEHAQFLDNHSRASQRLLECGKRGESATEAARREIAAIDKDIERSLQIKEGTYSAEIRADFKSMKSNERIADAMKAIETGDTTTLAAILVGPPRCSGLTGPEQAMIRSQYMEKHAAPLIARKKAISFAIEMNSRGNLDAINANSALFPPETVAEIKARMVEAREARQAL